MVGIYKIENLITGKISLGAFNAIWYNQSWKGVI